MKYEFKLQSTATDAARNINKAYGDNQRTVQCWFKRFKSADKSLENKQRGKPETIVNDEVIRNLIEKDTFLWLVRCAQHAVNRPSWFFPVNSCGTHLSIFCTFPMECRCLKKVEWVISNIFASSGDVWHESSSINFLMTLSSTIVSGFQRCLFSRDSSADLNLLNQYCTVRWLTVSSP